MRNILLSLLSAAICLPALSQESSGPLSLIPEPVSQQLNPGHFTLPTALSIEDPGVPELAQTLTDLAARLGLPTGYTVNFSHPPGVSATIRIILNKTADPVLG